MLTKIDLLRNVGQFDSTNPGQAVPLNLIAVIYAENGRGKTTLAEILRSLSSGDATLIDDRRRLGAQHRPHIVLTINGQQYLFQNGAWSSSFSDIAIFDDRFIAENVCSGIEVATEHRQNLHELILGAQGVSLNAALQTHVSKIEDHNRNLREREAAIPVPIRGDFTVDAFCNLAEDPNVEKAIQETERNISAARSTDAVKQQPNFFQFQLPSFDIEKINGILQRNLLSIQSETTARVQKHFYKIGKGSEAWISDGMKRIATDDQERICPFCAQNLSTSPIISYYETYFSEGYALLKQDITNEEKATKEAHKSDIQTAFERDIRHTVEKVNFWKSFMELPTIVIDTAEISSIWTKAKDLVLEAFRAKLASPLEKMTLPVDAIEAVTSYDEHRKVVKEISDGLQALNAQIDLIKEKADAANVAALIGDLNKLKAAQARHSRPIAGLCQAYLDEKQAKRRTGEKREQAKQALDQYRTNVFPQYEAAINKYLGKFNAAFRLQSVSSVNTRGGASCTYSVLVNNFPVPITSDNGASFKNTLSAGDRNALALAFFFASLDQDSNLSQKIVVIDDPMTSLDEHRTLATIQEIRVLANKVKQVIVLSHSKPFLCQIWEGANTTSRSAAVITRNGQSSGIALWDVSRDLITENDRRHALVKDYITAGDQTKQREVATALRHILEAFLRVSYPIEFPPGSMLGHFHNRCQQLGTTTQILSQQDTNELHELTDYANRFHHDTNSAYETEQINDQELLSFCKRTIAFTRR